MRNIFNYIPFFIYVITVVTVNIYFIRNSHFRNWFLKSFEEHTGKPSGKALTAFAFVNVIIFACFWAIISSEKHLLPPYMFNGIMMLIGGLYGVKLMSNSRWMNNSFSEKNKNVSQSSTSSSTNKPG